VAHCSDLCMKCTLELSLLSRKFSGEESKRALAGGKEPHRKPHLHRVLAQNHRGRRICTMEFNPQLRTPPLGNTRPGPLADMRERRGLRVAKESAQAIQEISSYMGEFRRKKFEGIDGNVYEVDAIPTVGSASNRRPWTVQFVNGLLINISVPVCTFQVAVGQPQPIIKIDGKNVNYLDPLENQLVVGRSEQRIYLECYVDDTSVDGLDTQSVSIVVMAKNLADQLVNLPTKRYIPVIDIDSDFRLQSAPWLSGSIYTTRFGDRRRIDNMFWYPL